MLVIYVINVSEMTVHIVGDMISSNLVDVKMLKINKL